MKQTDRTPHDLLAIEIAHDIVDDIQFSVDISMEVFDKLADVFMEYEEASLMRLATELINARQKQRRTDRNGKTN